MAPWSWSGARARSSAVTACAEAVRRLRADPEVPLVSAMLDQTRVAGLGNLWANELAFILGRSPWTPVGEVDVERLVTLAARALLPFASLQRRRAAQS